MASNRYKKKNKLPNLEPIGSSQISVTNHAPPPSFFSSSTDNIITSSHPVAPRRGPRMMAVPSSGTEECRSYPWGYLSLFIPRGQDVPADLLADEEERVAAEEARCKIEWVYMSDKKSLYLKMDLPGVAGKDDVKISTADNILMVKGEVKEDQENDKGIERKSYKGEFYLRPNLFKLDQVKAKMIKKGVLVVSLPKVKEKNRKEYIYPVKVE